MIVFSLPWNNELSYPQTLLMTFKFSLFLGQNRPWLEVLIHTNANPFSFLLKAHHKIMTQFLKNPYYTA